VTVLENPGEIVSYQVVPISKLLKGVLYNRSIAVFKQR
jgi:hypothetical protein